MPESGQSRSLSEVAAVFLKLGLTSFGGPVAHLGYFHDETVMRRRWLTESEYADLVALCQFLPGPGSSQLAFALGRRRAGIVGALTASLCFLMPSAVAMILFAYGIAAIGDVSHADWLHGLRLAAAGVVAQAVANMGRRLCPDLSRVAIAVFAAAAMLSIASAFAQIACIAGGGLAGWLLFSRVKGTGHAIQSKGTGSAAGSNRLEGTGHGTPADSVKGTGPLTPEERTDPAARLNPMQTHIGAMVAFVVFVVLLLVFPALAAATGQKTLSVLAGFYRSGSLVFGGGHVVLPLLRTAVVQPGWISDAAFLAGYGAAQALPGPLFSFSAYLGTVITGGPNAWLGGLGCLFAIYLPAWLLIGGALPFWHSLRGRAWMEGALRGANAAVVGILLAALYDPIWKESVHTVPDLAVTAVAFVLLQFVRTPPWAVVLLCAAAGGFLR